MAEPLRRRIRARALRAFGGAIGTLPAPLSRAFLGSLAAAARFSRFERRILDNLELAYGEELDDAGRRRIARGVRRHSARLAHEWARLSRGSRSEEHARRLGGWIDRQVAFERSAAILDRQLASGRGVLIVTAHLGNWELLCAALHRRGHRGHVIGRRRVRDRSSDWLIEMRRAYGVETLPQDASPRRLLELLRSGRTLGMLADLEVPRLDGVFVPFFGVPALTLTAPAALARAARVPVILVRCAARGGGYLLSAEEPLELDRGLDRREAVREIVARMNRRFEAWIRETPEQWAWHQPRWRIREGEREILPGPARKQRGGARRTEGPDPGPDS